jgi:hypothetical protein
VRFSSFFPVLPDLHAVQISVRLMVDVDPPFDFPLVEPERDMDLNFDLGVNADYGIGDMLVDSPVAPDPCHQLSRSKNQVWDMLYIHPHL